jgi:hypothetical protein
VPSVMDLATAFGRSRGWQPRARADAIDETEARALDDEHRPRGTAGASSQ